MRNNFDTSQTKRNNLQIEEVKQITVDMFRTTFTKINVAEIIGNLDKQIDWINKKDYFTTYNKDDIEMQLQKGMVELPEDTVWSILSLNVTRMMKNCYSVGGEIEYRLHYNGKIIYTKLEFVENIIKAKEKYSIMNIHFFQLGIEVQDSNNMLKKDDDSMSVTNWNTQDKYDSLTGLFKLDSFKDVTKNYLITLEDNDQLFLVYTDIMNFEKINNLYGFRKADSLLLELSSILATCCKSLVYACRSVADHFVLFMKAKDMCIIQREIDIICDQFNQFIYDRFEKVDTRLGMGVYMVHDKLVPLEIMLENANIARKTLSRHMDFRVAFYDEDTCSRRERRYLIEKTMRQALDVGEFQVFLQPKYNLKTGKIVGAEALIRWIHVDGTIVYPDEFIPAFEKNGFIEKTDFFVLEQVCMYLRRRMKSKKVCVPISVNQSRFLMKNGEYTNHVSNILTKYNTPPELIELELTERLFSDKPEEMAMIMEELKSIGIRWSIDDFGTGYSSLSLLKELPFDIIKIDKGFLNEADISEQSRVIIRKMVELVRELNKAVVCEGVETENQATYLRTIHCDMVQGFLYARPMPMSEFEMLLG